MTEPTITCPNCKTEIKLTESLAAPLIESTRRQFEQRLAQKDTEIIQREQTMRDKEKQLAEDKRKLDDQVASQVAEQLKDNEKYIVLLEEIKKAEKNIEDILSFLRSLLLVSKGGDVRGLCEKRFIGLGTSYLR